MNTGEGEGVYKMEGRREEKRREEKRREEKRREERQREGGREGRIKIDIKTQRME